MAAAFRGCLLTYSYMEMFILRAVEKDVSSKGLSAIVFSMSSTKTVPQ